MQMRREILSWAEVDKLIDHLIPQFETEFEAMLIITRGGIIPGGLLAESMQIRDVLIASVDFPADIDRQRAKLFAWPKFSQFPTDDLMEGRRILVVDDVWGSGRTITTVKNRISAAGGLPYTAVMHFNPHRNLFGTARPDYYAAITDAYIIYPWEIDRGLEKVEQMPIGEG
jgi:hypoxanthine phosphoribosyltransferase